MSKILCLKGVIRDINYDPQVRTKPLEQFALDGFDINAPSRGSGIIEFEDDTSFGFSKWEVQNQAELTRRRGSTGRITCRRRELP